MSKVRQLGQHTVSLEEETGFVVFKHVGELSAQEAQAVMDAIFEWLKPEEPLFMLSDSTQAKSMSPEARAVFGRATGIKRKSYVAFFGSSFQMRVISNLLLTAMRLIAGDTIGSFEADEAKARAWLTEKKQAHGRAA